MMNLQQGVFTINGHDISSQTSERDLARFFRCRSALSGDGSIRLFTVLDYLEIDDQRWAGHFSFSNQKLYSFKLIPCPIYPVDCLLPEKKQELRRKLCNEFLERWLGTPDRVSPEQSLYCLPWGSVVAVSAFNARGDFDLGLLRVQYSL